MCKKNKKTAEYKKVRETESMFVSVAHNIHIDIYKDYTVVDDKEK